MRSETRSPGSGNSLSKPSRSGLRAVSRFRDLGNRIASALRTQQPKLTKLRLKVEVNLNRHVAKWMHCV